MKRHFHKFLSLFLPFIASSCCYEHNRCEWQEYQGDCCLNACNSSPWSFSPKSRCSEQIICEAPLVCEYQNPVAFEEPTVEQAAIEEPAVGQAVIEEPALNQTVAEEPVTEQAVTEESATEQAVTEGPTTEQTVTEEPTTEQAIPEEPATEQAIPEEPATEQPVNEEPAKEQAATEEPAITTKALGGQKEEKSTEPDLIADLKENPTKYLHFIATLDEGNFLILVVKNKGSTPLQEITVKVSTPSLPHLAKENVIVKFDGSVVEGADLTAQTTIGPFANFDELKDSLQVNFVGALPSVTANQNE